MKIFIFLAIAILCASGVLAHGRLPGFPQGKIDFDTLDKNKDGKITRDEWNQWKLPGQLFDSLDKNHDGVITRDELPFTFGGGKPATFETMDTNKDGKVSRDELKGASELFDKLDKNHDGVLTKDEFGPGSAVSFGGGPAAPGVTFETFDKNKDGKILKDEWEGQTESFGSVDLNHDGAINAEEYQQLIERRNELADYNSLGANLSLVLRNYKEGKVSKSDFQKLPSVLKKFDKDKDLKLSAEEIGAMLSSPAAELFKSFGASPSSPASGSGQQQVITFGSASGSLGGLASSRPMLIPRIPPDRLRRLSERLVQAFDADHDGSLSSDELDSVVALFDKLDLDKDGSLSNEELGAILLVSRSERTAATGGIDVDQFLQRYDRNKDGKLTADEVNNARLFKALDINNDGVVTREEIERWIRTQTNKPNP